MNVEEVRLRSLLYIRTGDDKYIKDIPIYMQYAGLYPEIIGVDDTEKLNELKERLDKTL